MENDRKLKRVWEKRLELEEQHGKIKQKYLENNEGMCKLIEDKELENSQLRKQNEQMQKTINNLKKQNYYLESKSKADQKKIRNLVKNNAKKRKLLDAEFITDAWDIYSLEESDDDEGQKRWEELEGCWNSSDESADEAD